MEKIISINYQGRTLTIEETAYHAFQTYEADLKTYFLKEEGGEETFADLQNRMAEILDQKINAGSSAINSNDIQELIEMIGKPSDLDAEHEEKKQTQIPPTEKKKVYRNTRDKMIAGVCSGIANYFDIDTIAVRLIFVLFSIFNIISVFKSPLGFIVYIILWIALTPKRLTPNVSSKLFRNPKDKVLGGVCSGIAQFFNTDSWKIRLVFLAPIILQILLRHQTFDIFDFPYIGHSFISFSIISYIIFWFIVPLAKSATDFMLLKGEPITISSIQNPTSLNNVSNTAKNGITIFFKVIAYIILGIVLVIIIPTLISFLVLSICSFNLSQIVLFDAYNQTLAIGTFIFFILVPSIGFFVWIVRRIAGYRGKSRVLRSVFIGLNSLGWVCAILLLAGLVKENNTYISKEKIETIATSSDTIRVEPFLQEQNTIDRVIFSFNEMSHLIEQTPTMNNVKGVRVHYKESIDSNFSIKIETSSFGRNVAIANQNADLAVYEHRIEGNTLYLSSMLGVSNKVPYHFQNIKVTIYVPKHKVLIVSEKLKQQLKHRIITNNKNFYYNSDSPFDIDHDEVIRFDNSGTTTTTVTDDNGTTTTVTETNDDDAKQSIEDAKLEAQQTIEEAKRDATQAQQEAQQQIEQANREHEQAKLEAQRRIDDANRDFEKSKREAEQKIEQAKQKLNTK